MAMVKKTYNKDIGYSIIVIFTDKLGPVPEPKSIGAEYDQKH